MRDLLADSEYVALMEKMNYLGKILNRFIQTIGNKVPNEDELSYGLTGTNKSPMTND